MASGGHICLRTGTILGRTQLDYKLNISGQWSRRRCDKEIVIVLSNEHFTILKVGRRSAIYFRQTEIIFGRTHLDIDRNSYASSGFGGDAIKVKIIDVCRWPHLSTDRNHFRADTTRLLGEHLRQVSKKSDKLSRRRCDNETKVYGRTDGLRMVH